MRYNHNLTQPEHYNISSTLLKLTAVDYTLLERSEEMEKPAYAVALEKGDPQALDMVKKLQDLVLKDGALSAKVKMLMCMLGDAMQGQYDGVKVLAERARALGATEAEIAETVRVALYMGGMPGLVTATRAFRE